MMKKATYICLALVVLAVGAVLGFSWLRDNKLPNFRKQAEIYVYPGTTADEVLEQIADKAQVLSRKSLERCFKAKKVAEFLTPGHYTVSPRDPSVYVAAAADDGTAAGAGLAGRFHDILGKSCVDDADDQFEFHFCHIMLPP